MSQRFRPPPKRWSKPLACAVVLFAVLYLTQSPSNSDRLSPQQWQPKSGEYSLRRINDDATLDVTVPSSSSNRFAKIELLSVDVPDVQLRSVVQLLRERFGPSDHPVVLTLRFDRRRTSEASGELQAYVYHGDVLLNELVVQRGMAAEATHGSDSGAMSRRIKKAEQAAKEAGLGIWKTAKEP